MKGAKILAILVLGLMVCRASVAWGYTSLIVNNHPEDSITLRVGQVCVVEIVSDNSNPYNAYVGFDNGLTLGSFTHLSTEPNAGDLADYTEYDLPVFYGYFLVAAGSAPHPSAGIHFVFQYEVQEIGETELKIYDPNLTVVIDSVHIIVVSAEMGTAFTYQGLLMDSNKPADDQYDFEFLLYNAPTYGNQLGSTSEVNDLDVIDGLFEVELDFGSDVFDGNAVWLEICVRPGDSNDVYTTLSPRHKVTPVSQAVYASVAAAVQPPGGGGIVPRGGIIMWSGSINDIPNGWALCDGTNNTPDLTSSFIRSVPNATIDPGSTGGSTTHSHGSGTYSSAGHSHSYEGITNNNTAIKCQDEGGSCSHDSPETYHSHVYNGNTDPVGEGAISGTSGDGSSLPPYYELAFIMKL